jgi:hypothetical protein
MSALELDLLYQEHIAGLSTSDQLRLASCIIQAAAEKEQTEESPEQAAEVVRRQKEALRKVCGMVSGGDPNASVRHDEILYGPIRS